MIKRKPALAFLTVLFLSATTFSFATTTPTVSARVGLSSDLIYFVMPDRYKDGNTADDKLSGFNRADTAFYHGGDLKGLTGTCAPGDDGLARIKAMGFTAVWVTPLVRQSAPTVVSAGYHGYWGVDFLNVDPHLGTNADLVAFSECAKKLKLKLILDIVTNHTADIIQYNGTEAYIPSNWTKIKSPNWLNDLSNYHNVGDMGKCWGDGDCTTLGDFYGLDDLATEKPAVYKGWADVYGQWIAKYGFSGFRVDTAKHVDTEFFKHWQPLILEKAKTAGVSNFTIFGEVTNPTAFGLMTYVRENKIQTVLDFPFQTNATDFASGVSDAASLGTFFLTDDYYTSPTSAASNLVTFLGNHDMGRVGFILNTMKIQTPSELLARDELAHALMYFSRGIPTVYYGDEVGMTGSNSGNDQMARQDMFATQIADWKSELRIGGKPIGNGNSFALAKTNPLPQYLTMLAGLRASNPALANGVMQTRLAKGTVYAVSKKDPLENREYVVAFNNGLKPQSITLTTATSSGGWKILLGKTAYQSTGTTLKFAIPALSTVVLKANKGIDEVSVKTGKITVAVDDMTGYYRASASLTSNDLLSVEFFVKTSASTTWASLGSDTNAPYSVFINPKEILGPSFQIKAVATNSNGKVFALPSAEFIIPAS
ncbi:MAG: alpha-amylase family glycosyl hydrolase [Actinomycetes bacterium]|jgi:alpha-amylase